ncbi:hypothetical protein [Apilactobacillus timberlakei]|uniref:Uncharacterized protein n=1 Tax=Apilactobacillus timberlakei TaxID=2008380 RepID=A0ABY2YS57_9LACO|nr:hypothetical protein [Apilactobacillus timberlakei]TPR12764.1 hypothetical protein DY048_07070 [Apilactobacillus timberlakei]TPR13647.1 hypothetical protein DY052_07940 [Apilactobacillus timberlakei]
MNGLDLLETNLKKLNDSSFIKKTDSNSYELCDDMCCFAEVFPDKKLVKCYENVTADFFDAIKPFAKEHELLFINYEVEEPIDPYECGVPEILRKQELKMKRMMNHGNLSIYETLKQIANSKITALDTQPNGVKFIDVVKQMEKINGKKYQLFDYRKIENVLKAHCIYTVDCIVDDAKERLSGSLIGKSDLYVDAYKHRSTMLNDYDGGCLCTMVIRIDGPRVLNRWQDFKEFLSEKIEEDAYDKSI